MLAFTYPFDLTTYAGPVKLTTSALLMVILTAVLVGRLIWTDSERWQRTQLDLPVLAFAAATFLSVLGMAGHWEDQMVGLLKALGGFITFFLATQTLRTRTDVLIVIAAVIATATVQATALAVQVLTGSVVVSEDTRAMGTLDNPNLYAGYLVLVIPIGVAVGVSFRSWWATAATAAVMISFSIALIATLSRSGWAGAIVGIVVVAAVFRERRWMLLALFGAIAVVAVIPLFIPIAARIAPHAVGPGEMVSARTDIWMVAVSAAMQHPLFGIGVANFVNYYPQYGGTNPGINHAHNLFLNMFVERGVIGFLTFVAFLGYLVRSLARSLGTAHVSVDRALLAALIGSFTGYLVHSLAEVSYYDYKVLLLFWLFAGVAAISSRRVAERSSILPLLALAV